MGTATRRNKRTNNLTPSGQQLFGFSRFVSLCRKPRSNSRRAKQRRGCVAPRRCLCSLDERLCLPTCRTSREIFAQQFCKLKMAKKIGQCFPVKKCCIPLTCSTKDFPFSTLLEQQHAQVSALAVAASPNKLCNHKRRGDPPQTKNLSVAISGQTCSPPDPVC